MLFLAAGDVDWQLAMYVLHFNHFVRIFVSQKEFNDLCVVEFDSHVQKSLHSVV